MYKIYFFSLIISVSFALVASDEVSKSKLNPWGQLVYKRCVKDQHGKYQICDIGAYLSEDLKVKIAPRPDVKLLANYRGRAVIFGDKPDGLYPVDGHDAIYQIKDGQVGVVVLDRVLLDDYDDVVV